MSEKTKGQLLGEELLLKRENGSSLMDDQQLTDAIAFCEGYKAFLDAGKTEREVVNLAIDLATKNGFTEFDATKKISSWGQSICK